MLKGFFIAGFCAGLVAAPPINGSSQDVAPKGEIFVGGSKLWEHAGGGPYHNHGPKLAFTGNLNRFLGLEMDLVKFRDRPTTAPAFGDYFRFLFGPHFA